MRLLARGTPSELPVRTSRSRSVRLPTASACVHRALSPTPAAPSFICLLCKKLLTCVAYGFFALASYARLSASNLRFMRDASRRLQGYGCRTRMDLPRQPPLFLLRRGPTFEMDDVVAHFLECGSQG